MAILDRAQYDPALRFSDRTSQTWGSGGNTCTITNAHVRASSIIDIQHTSDPLGHWFITASAGSFVITSDMSESSGTTFIYSIS